MNSESGENFHRILGLLIFFLRIMNLIVGTARFIHLKKC